MKTFTDQCRQGDVLFCRVDELPNDVVRVNPQTDNVVVAHSETGHHHVMDADKVEMYRLPEEIYECFLVVNQPAMLKHLRPHDTHEPIMFEPGVYRVRRQREYTPEGLRRVAD